MPVIHYVAASIATYALMRVIGPRRINRQLIRAHADDWVAGGVVVGIVALMVSL
jgi:hypothetical protein